MRKLYIENGMAFWVDKDGDHIYHKATEDDLCAYISELKATLREARRWIGDGDMADGLSREIWTPAYAAAVDLVDRTLKQSETPPIRAIDTSAEPVEKSAKDRQMYIALSRIERLTHEAGPDEVYRIAVNAMFGLPTPAEAKGGV